jgi:Cu/Zn superoxide dismutase
MKNTALALAVLMLFALPLTAKTANTKVQLQDSQGKSVGTALISQTKSSVAIRLDLHGLPPGEERRW